MNFNKIPITSRLIISFLLIILAIIVIGTNTIIQMRKSSEIARDIYNHPYVVSNSVRDIQINIVLMHRSMKDVVLSESDEELNETISLVNDYEQSAIAKFDLVFKRYLGPRSDIEEAYKVFLDWQTIRNEVFSLVKADQHDSAIAITKGKGLDHIELIFTKIKGLVEFADEKVITFQDDMFARQRREIRGFIILVGIMLIVSIFIAFVIIRSITIPVNETIKRIKEISQKHFNVEIDLGKGEQLGLLSQSVEQLDSVAEELNKEMKERVKIQLELEEYKTELEKLVEKRTRELGEAQKLLRKSIDDASVGVVTVSPDGNFIKVNRKFCDMIGYEEDELTQMKFQEVTYPEDYSIGADIMKKLIEGKINQAEINKRYLRKDGDVIHVRLFTTLIRDKAGKPVYFFTQALDITKRIQAEEQLKEYQSKLELIIDERTKSLLEKTTNYENSQLALSYLMEDVNEARMELEKANAQAQVLNKELEAFSYSVSHDLRAPLRAINGFTRILMEDYIDKFDDEGKRLGSVIQASSQKMGQLIDDLLAFSKLSRKSMRYSKIDMKNMVVAIYHEATSPDERNRIDFSIPDLPEANGDPNMFRQVWMNLITNAVKFSSNRSKAVISVTCREEETELVYCINDNGAGFDMKYKDKLFGVFQRLHNERDFPGTGVGLALVQRIIHRHHGDIWAESEVNKGSSFFFSLPKK